MMNTAYSSPALAARARGFTIVELMIVLLIAGILAAIAVPSFQSAIANQRVKTFAQNLYLALGQARSEAIKFNGACRVSIVPADQTGAVDWSQGFYVVADQNPPVAGGNCSADPATNTALDITNLAAPQAAILAVFDADPDDPNNAGDDVNDPTDDAHYLVDGVSIAAGAPAGRIDYNRRGRISAVNGGAPGTVSFTVCDTANNATKRVVTAGLSGLPEVRTSGNCP